MRFLLTTILLAAASAQAGIVTKFSHRTPGSGGTDSTTYQQGDFARSDVFELGETTPTYSLLIDAAKESFVMMRHKEKTYFRTTVAELAGLVDMAQSSLQEMNAKNPAMRKELEAMLAKLPKDQQKQMRDMLAEADRATKPVPKLSPPRKLPGTHLVDKWACKRYEEKIGENRVVTCYAPYSTLKLTPEETTFFKRTLAMIDKLTTSLKEEGPRQGFFAGRFDLGIGVETVTYHGEKIVSRGELVKWERKPVDETVFQLPKGYVDQTAALFPKLPGKPKPAKKKP